MNAINPINEDIKALQSDVTNLKPLIDKANTLQDEINALLPLNSKTDTLQRKISELDTLKSKIDELVSKLGTLENSTVPVGTIIAYPTSNVPHGFLRCDGSGLNRSVYYKLYEALGNPPGNDTTFYLPNLIGTVLRGSQGSISVYNQDTYALAIANRRDSGYFISRVNYCIKY